MAESNTQWLRLGIIEQTASVFHLMMMHSISYLGNAKHFQFGITSVYVINKPVHIEKSHNYCGLYIRKTHTHKVCSQTSVAKEEN